MKKRFAAILTAFAMLLPLAACAPQSAEAEEPAPLIRVGFSQVGAESDWRVANTESMRRSLSEENGFELLFSNARQKQENQFKAIRTFIQQDVDYIVLAPVTETGWQSVLEEARDAGIPVIIVDRQIDAADDSLYLSYVGSDFRGTADTAMQELERMRGSDTPLRILHLKGTLGSTPQLQRTAALEAAVRAHANWTIAAQLEGEFTQAKAYELALAWLRDDPQIDVVYCENDNMCFGVMQAMDELGIRYGAGGVTLVTFDAVRSALQGCLAGSIDLCAECNPLQGPRVRAIIEQYESGQTPEKHAYVPERVFTKADLTDAFIEAREY